MGALKGRLKEEGDGSIERKGGGSKVLERERVRP